WVQGKKYVVYKEDSPDIRGTYDLNIQNNYYVLTITGELPPFQAEVKLDTAKTKATVIREGLKITVSFLANDKVFHGSVRLSGNIHFDSGMWDGNGVLPGGTNVKWTAIRKERNKPAVAKVTEPDSLFTGKMIYPFKSYGTDSIPEHKVVVIKNATIWTNENEGVLKNADLVIKDGKISYVGKPLASYEPGAWIINAEGKHVTAGIIDEHSHIAIAGGVNEGGQANSAEVSIADVIFPDDINIYRQLAGGVTTSQLLHGSANPIGGRSAIIKLRWGASADGMVFKEAPGFIKFALGENVKQSNWGDGFRIRYPQSRMGVEQVFYDAFHRAKAYDAEWKTFNANKTKSKKPLTEPRRDIELDALVEILNAKRFITCHSYVQSEINMLMHVADSMGFKVNTFTHILEGYKVADKMAAHGASGSSFSDWWAYKFEVYDAIPHNPAIMHKQGVNVGINSDDAEMARRLNQEAAKSVKYGGVSEEEALKMVTLNPAKMLHVNHLTGSILVGKQADIVIWSNNPLSVYAKAEKTFVDGTCYYDSDRDKQLRKEIAAERERIIRKMLEAKSKGAKTQTFKKRPRKQYECETMGYDEEDEY
ncbi:MAG: amidohydrolase family protein, partial [Flavobacteriales bacterium]